MTRFLARIAPWVQANSWEAMGIDPDVDSMSSLLVAVCCLQGLRVSESRNTPVHADLYEHVRRELATVHLISPLPMDCLHALSCMTLWNMAPLVRFAVNFSSDAKQTYEGSQLIETLES